MVGAMGRQRSNLEIVARDICARQIAKTCTTADELQQAVNRFWHIVAVQIEAGIVDEAGRDLAPIDDNRRLAALRDWRTRHPEYEAPPWKPSQRL